MRTVGWQLRWQSPWRRIGALAVAGVVAASCLAPLHADPEPVRRRGRFLRTEIARTERTAGFGCSLASRSGSSLVLRLRREELVVDHEVSIYEVVVEETARHEDTDRMAIVYRVLPGEEMRGELNVRQTSRDLGPLANADLTVGGIPFRTDADGFAVDREQRLLRRFDDLAVNTIQVNVVHAEMGETALVLSRYLTRRPEDIDRDERIRMAQMDVLVAMGCRFEPTMPSDNKGLQVRVAWQEALVPGTRTPIVVTVHNAGTRPVSCLLGRLFGRHDWLAGMNFYFGNLRPGESRSFERLVSVPENLAPQPVYATLGFWDILGAVKGAQQAIVSRIDASQPSPETP